MTADPAPDGMTEGEEIAGTQPLANGSRSGSDRFAETLKISVRQDRRPSDILFTGGGEIPVAATSKIEPAENRKGRLARWFWRKRRSRDADRGVITVRLGPADSERLAAAVERTGNTPEAIIAKALSRYLNDL